MKLSFSVFRALLFMLILTRLEARPVRANPGVGDQVHQITVPVSGVQTRCSIGLAFDGQFLYYDRCSDKNIYKIDPVSGALKDTFPSGIAEFPNALAYDRTRNGIWIGAQQCTALGMPIYFWDLDDNSVTQAFTIPRNLTNPATGQSFLFLCFADGLAFDANDTTDPSDDEIWFNDDVNPNIGVFRPNGTFLRGYNATTIDPSLSRTSGLAIGGEFLYLGNNGGGDVFRANKSANPLALFDQFTNGDTRQEDMECDPVTFAPTEVMWVRTTPQGGQFPDVITAYEIEPGSCGAGGAPVDSDGDGLYDVWETEGVTIDPDGNGPIPAQFIDLPAMHANKDVPDIFVHMDWMSANNHNHKLRSESLKLIVDAFARRNIRLHVDQGSDSILDFSTGRTWGGLSRARAIPEFYELDVNGTLATFSWNGFQALKDGPGGFTESGRAPVFHYVISAHHLFTITEPGKPVSCGPSGVSRSITKSASSDFILALGGYFLDGAGKDRCDPDPASTNAGTLEQQAGTFMHELGHNLGLNHGGGDSINHKPNYLSVMNYAFQLRGLVREGKEGYFDYSGSHMVVPPINEMTLDEQAGLFGLPFGIGTRKFNCDQDHPDYVFVSNAIGPIDWNCNGAIDTVPVQANINGDSGDGIFSDEEILRSWNDWENLVFDGGLIGLGAAAEDLPITTSIDEMTPEDAAQIEPVALPGSVHAILYMTENLGTLRRVDQETGTTTIVGMLGTNYIVGLSNRPGDTTYIYGVEPTGFGGAGPSRLVKINTLTGVSTPLPVFDEATLGISNPTATAIAISPLAPNIAVVTGFNIVNGGGYYLWKVNFDTGMVLGPAIPTTAWVWELAYSLDGSVLYGANDDGQLVTVNSETGDVALVGDPGLNTIIEGLAFRPSDGELLAIDGYLSDRLVRLDPSNGSLLEVIGDLGVVGPNGLAFIPGYELSVSKTGNGNGVVWSIPNGIECGSTCSYAFNADTEVTLHATASDGSEFTGWDGGGCTDTVDCTVTMDAAKSISANFSGPPGKVTLTAPSGPISSNRPAYSWNADSAATWYYLWVNGPAGKVYAKWYQSSSICSGDTCSVTPPIKLQPEKHTWWVQTWNPAGYGPWSDGMYFTPTPPEAATPVAPTGDIGTNYNPTYTWDKVSDATWYYLWVNSPSGNVIKQWYEASAVCGASICSVTPDKTLAGGAHTFWVRTWNSAGYGPWSSNMNFSTTPLGAATLVSPDGSITDTTPTYTWDTVPGATWYYLWVNAPSGTSLLKQWFQASEVCTGNTCYFTPTTTLSSGAHTWWVRTWNSAGYGPWSDAANFSLP